MTVEKKVSDAILQKPIEITLNGNIYKVERPRMGTIIQACEFISELPQDKVNDDEFLATLLNAKYYKAIANVVVTLVCGMNSNYDEDVVRMDVMQETDENILNVLISVLNALDTNVFFSLITFLNGVNITKPTTMTASGQPSADLQNTTT